MTHRTCHPPSKYLRPVVRGQLFKIGYFCILDILEAQSCVSRALYADFWAYSFKNFQIDAFLKTKQNKIRLCGKLNWPICSENWHFPLFYCSLFCEWVFADTSTANATPLKTPSRVDRVTPTPTRGGETPRSVKASLWLLWPRWPNLIADLLDIPSTSILIDFKMQHLLSYMRYGHDSASIVNTFVSFHHFWHFDRYHTAT